VLEAADYFGLEMSRVVDGRRRRNKVVLRNLRDVEIERTWHRGRCSNCIERLCYLDFWKGLKDMFSSVEPNLEVEIIARPNFVWDGKGITSSEFGEKMVLSKVRTKLKFKCLIDPQRCSKHWTSQHSLVHLYYKLTKSKNK